MDGGLHPVGYRLRPGQLAQARRVQDVGHDSIRLSACLVVWMAWMGISRERGGIAFRGWTIISIHDSFGGHRIREKGRQRVAGWQDSEFTEVGDGDGKTKKLHRSTAAA